MLLEKDQVIQIIQELPDEVTVDDIMSELYFKLQVDGGLKELDEGKGIPHERDALQVHQSNQLRVRGMCDR